MSLVYLTADKISEVSGGGLVTANELAALREFSEEQTRARRDPLLSDVIVLSRNSLGNSTPEPWKWDLKAIDHIRNLDNIKLCHIYSGTWPTAVPALKEQGAKVCVTIAAHNKEISRREHEKLGWPFPYTHLTNEQLWQHYIKGYRLADVIICPSSVAANIVRNYGEEFRDKDIRIIPHGCHLPEKIEPLSKTFRVGYLGSYGADKGVRYLLEAWKKLDYKDGSQLILAGRDMAGARHLMDRFGGGSVHLAGWQRNVSDFYNSIFLYVQPSATEGFGIEVLESLAHGRPTICSVGAGAKDVVNDTWHIPACDADAIARSIDQSKLGMHHYSDMHQRGWREIAEKHTWDKIHQQYKKVWAEMLG